MNHFLDGSSLPTSNMPNLPRVWGTLRTANAVHLVYPLSVVADMSTFIRTHSEGLSNVSYVAYAMYAIVSALEVLHEGSMVYRAIQPESIYIDSEGKRRLRSRCLCVLPCRGWVPAWPTVNFTWSCLRGHVKLVQWPRRHQPRPSY